MPNIDPTIDPLTGKPKPNQQATGTGQLATDASGNVIPAQPPGITPPQQPQVTPTGQPAAPVTPTDQPQDPNQPAPAPKSTYTGNSIVDFLGSSGQPNDFKSRSKLAASKGIQDYMGTAQQNTQLLNMLKKEQGAQTPGISAPGTNQATGDSQSKTNESGNVVPDKTDAGNAGGADPNISDPNPIQTQIDNTMAEWGLTPAKSDIDPYVEFTNHYQQLFTSLGMPDLKTQIDTVTKKYSGLNNELADKIASVNEDPWLDEGTRKGRIQALQDRYDLKMNPLTNQLNLYQSMYDKGIQQAQYIATAVNSSVAKEKQLEQNALIKAADMAVKQAIAEDKLLTSQAIADEKIASAEQKLQETLRAKTVNKGKYGTLEYDPETGTYVPVAGGSGSGGGTGSGGGGGLGGGGSSDPTNLDQMSSSLLSQTGLSYDAFRYLTEGNQVLTRMSESSRAKVKAEARKFTTSKGLDESTFQTQYKANNDVLASNISRMARTQIMEQELLGTTDNLASVVDLKKLGKVNLNNVAKVWLGQEVNDDLATQYAFHFQQLKNELAGYFAASQGKSSPDVIDNTDAGNAVRNGMASGSLAGFKASIENSTKKMSKVLQGSVNNAQSAVWKLFGANKPNSTSKSSGGSVIMYKGKKYQTDAQGNFDPNSPL